MYKVEMSSDFIFLDLTRLSNLLWENNTHTHKKSNVENVLHIM